MVLRFPVATALTLATALGSAPLSAQEPGPDTLVFQVDSLEVTATRTARPIFRTPAPVLRLGSPLIDRTHASTVSDLFRGAAGMDVTGVGAQQTRPVIRGQGGQRILLLQDGIRLNNTRRQQDFGEIPSLVDVSAVERVEVLRGPASVLYGTDAIGGVVNVITRRPSADDFRGGLRYQFGSAGDQQRVSGSVEGTQGRFEARLGGSWRDAGSYRSASGDFGDIQLDDEAEVLGSGVEDRSLEAHLGWELAPGHRLFARGNGYWSESAGFGLVEPDLYSTGRPRIEITYPSQRFRKARLGYAGTGLDAAVADQIEASAYVQDNRRRLLFDFFQGFGPQAPPGAGIATTTNNFTDIGTLGLRLEAKKLLGGVLVTYGVDAFRDRTENTDSITTTVSGFGPPQVEVSTRPQIPDARYRSLGAFVQGEGSLGDVTIIVGARAQDISAETRTTEGSEVEPTELGDGSVVGSANAIWAVGDRLSLIGSVGRGFRAPNLIEWFFEGPVPEAGAFQVRNSDLEAERSLNVDLGARWRGDRLSLEGFVFRNEITNGIRSQATGREVDGLDEFRNVNLEELVFRGLELSAEVRLAAGMYASGSWSHLDSEDALDPDNPIGESVSNKWVGEARYDDPARRFWAWYGVRHHGERKDASLDGNPLGEILPAFTVQNLGVGVRVFQDRRFEQRVALTVRNLADRLYAETSNQSFFRPEPGRSVAVSWEVVF